MDYSQRTNPLLDPCPYLIALAETYALSMPDLSVRPDSLPESGNVFRFYGTVCLRSTAIHGCVQNAVEYKCKYSTTQVLAHYEVYDTYVICTPVASRRISQS